MIMSNVIDIDDYKQKIFNLFSNSCCAGDWGWEGDCSA